MEQSIIIDTLETYQASPSLIPARPRVGKKVERAEGLDGKDVESRNTIDVCLGDEHVANGR